MPNDNCLRGRIILIVQPIWIVASGLASAFEAKGAKVVMTRNAHTDMADIPNLAVAVLDSHSRDLGTQLQARGIPFVLYAVRVDHECGAAAIIQKPALPSVVVARVEALLT
jgi:hypothetical protein